MLPRQRETRNMRTKSFHVAGCVKAAVCCGSWAEFLCISLLPEWRPLDSVHTVHHNDKIISDAKWPDKEVWCLFIYCLFVLSQICLNVQMFLSFLPICVGRNKRSVGWQRTGEMCPVPSYRGWLWWVLVTFLWLHFPGIVLDLLPHLLLSIKSTLNINPFTH